MLRFRPFHTEPSDVARVHGTNERLAVADLAPAISFYTRLISGDEVAVGSRLARSFAIAKLRWPG